VNLRLRAEAGVDSLIRSISCRQAAAFLFSILEMQSAEIGVRDVCAISKVPRYSTRWKRSFESNEARKLVPRDRRVDAGSSQKVCVRPVAFEGNVMLVLRPTTRYSFAVCEGFCISSSAASSRARSAGI
jgi:hypothetical protein